MPARRDTWEHRLPPPTPFSPKPIRVLLETIARLSRYNAANFIVHKVDNPRGARLYCCNESPPSTVRTPALKLVDSEAVAAWASDGRISDTAVRGRSLVLFLSPSLSVRLPSIL